MKSIGITGGIGSGKSMVCKILEVLGYPVFYADQEAKKSMVQDNLLKEQIISLLGSDSYQDKELNRPFIAEKIFGNTDLKHKMDQLVHPAVFRSFESWKSKQTSPFIFNESALLFETGSYKRFNATVLVTADKETRIERVMKRDGVTRDQVISRMENQLSDAEKQKLCTCQIVNNPEMMLIPQVLEMLEFLK